MYQKTSPVEHFFFYAGKMHYTQDNNIHQKRLLSSDWLRMECSFSVTRVQITNGF